jgi:hypothetical protein
MVFNSLDEALIHIKEIENVRIKHHYQKALKQNQISSIQGFVAQITV